MLALEFQAPHTLGLVDAPQPDAADGDVIVDVVLAGICGTDLKITRGEHRLYPAGTVRVPGHEFVGRVREGRADGVGPATGTLVAVAPNISCGHCTSCRRGRANLCLNYESVGLTIDGAFAESVRIPARAVEQGNLIPVPDGLDPAVAVLMEPLAAVYRGLTAIGLVRGESLVILGAGPIGLIAVILARQLGAGSIIVSQTSAGRRQLAVDFGATVTIDPRAENLVDRVREETAEVGADCVLVATPVAELYPESLRLAAVGGRINFFAGLPGGRGEVPIDANLVHYNELFVTGSTANTTEDCEAALAILAADPGVYLPLISHRFALEDSLEAFRVSAAGVALKAVVEP
jgi:L-iditol 2-dehydrogenase